MARTDQGIVDLLRSLPPEEARALVEMVQAADDAAQAGEQGTFTAAVSAASVGTVRRIVTVAIGRPSRARRAAVPLTVVRNRSTRGGARRREHRAKRASSGGGGPGDDGEPSDGDPSDADLGRSA